MPPRRPRGARRRGRLPVRRARRDAADDHRPHAAPRGRAFATITARRPVVEWVLARAAQAEPGVEIRRGVAVEALTARSYDGTPHVTGVRTDRGDELARRPRRRRRRAPLAAAPPPRGRRRPPAARAGRGLRLHLLHALLPLARRKRPEYRAAPLLTAMPSFSVLTLPGDNEPGRSRLHLGGDRPLKALRHPENWDTVLPPARCHAHWAGRRADHRRLADGRGRRPLPPDGGRRRARRDGRGDARRRLGVHEPVARPRMTLGLMHARRLRDFVRYHWSTAPRWPRRGTR